MALQSGFTTQSQPQPNPTVTPFKSIKQPEQDSTGQDRSGQGSTDQPKVVKNQVVKKSIQIQKWSKPDQTWHDID